MLSIGRVLPIQPSMLPAEMQTRGFAVNSLDGVDYMQPDTERLGPLGVKEGPSVAARLPLALRRQPAVLRA